jgi:gluconolactonase
MKPIPVCCLLFCLAFPVLAAKAPVPPGVQPQNLGNVGAGEGAAWHPTRGLFFSGGGDRISNRDLNGKISVFREPSGGANGNAFDLQGRLVTCESGKKRITRTEPDGSITVLTDIFEGKHYNTPNDLSIDSQGRIYFTDPRYGPRDGMEQFDKEGKTIEGVYRIDAPGKVVRVLGRELERPNGILVSPDDKYLYVADNNNNVIGGARKLWRFDLRKDGSVKTNSRKLIFDWRDARGPDGFKMDSAGRLYVAAGLNVPNPPYETADVLKAGIYILSPKGKLLNFVPITTDEVTNCSFGGADLKTLFITAGGTLWSIPVNTAGWMRFTGK